MYKNLRENNQKYYYDLSQFLSDAKKNYSKKNINLISNMGEIDNNENENEYQTNREIIDIENYEFSDSYSDSDSDESSRKNHEKNYTFNKKFKYKNHYRFNYKNYEEKNELNKDEDNVNNLDLPKNKKYERKYSSIGYKRYRDEKDNHFDSDDNPM